LRPAPDRTAHDDSDEPPAGGDDHERVVQLLRRRDTVTDPSSRGRPALSITVA
jgi:hypothetical protein